MPRKVWFVPLFGKEKKICRIECSQRGIVLWTARKEWGNLGESIWLLQGPRQSHRVMDSADRIGHMWSGAPKEPSALFGKKFVVITHWWEQCSCVSEVCSMFSIQTYLEQWNNLIISSCNSQIQRWVPCCVLLLHACIAAVNTKHTGLNCLNSLQVTALSDGVACRWMMMWSNFGISGCSFPQGHGAGSGPPVVLSRCAGWLGETWAWGPATVPTLTGLGCTPLPPVPAELPHGEPCCCVCTGGMSKALITWGNFANKA